MPNSRAAAEALEQDLRVLPETARWALGSSILPNDCFAKVRACVCAASKTLPQGPLSRREGDAADGFVLAPFNDLLLQTGPLMPNAVAEFALPENARIDGKPLIKFTTHGNGTEVIRAEKAVDKAVCIEGLTDRD